ncbi:SDR family NAD(P)-dependent oxidoreductase [Undibacterium sp. TS12]|uniref:SDR family oxidoreductase n=1 Tax=Undibacterium sp. TS12 TaxID=2908202 RepID=UPI001F4C8DB1|nr:SDR family NAD(P)-dependent oxidoreductase [Undibacterium sp. TS12]MCH8622433.1 SDR family oxidoreductase [Undibacterium sp. TS12]
MSTKTETVMITGACGNLGRALARKFSQDGKNLILVDRHLYDLESTFGQDHEYKDQFLLLAADLCNGDQVAKLLESALKKYQAIDVLCNAAGGFSMGYAVHETADEDWDFLFDINVRSMLQLVRAIVPGMIDRAGGKIINVSAYAALKGVAGMGAYCAAKDVLIRMTESMSAELRQHHINVNCVLPSILDTPQNRLAMPDADPGKWVSPDELANVIAFLASDAARAIHGAALPVVGGC